MPSPSKQKQSQKRNRKEKLAFDHVLLDLARVTRVVKGGRRFRFRATVVAGNRKGKVGVGVAKGPDASTAIEKAYHAAVKAFAPVPIYHGTIASDVTAKQGSAVVLLKPARTGRGVVAGGAVRAVVELGGIQDIVSKSLGSSNKINVARATISALEKLVPSAVRRRKGSESGVHGDAPTAV